MKWINTRALSKNKTSMAFLLRPSRFAWRHHPILPDRSFQKLIHIGKLCTCCGFPRIHDWELNAHLNSQLNGNWNIIQSCGYLGMEPMLAESGWHLSSLLFWNSTTKHNWGSLVLPQEYRKLGYQDVMSYLTATLTTLSHYLYLRYYLHNYIFNFFTLATRAKIYPLGHIWGISFPWQYIWISTYYIWITKLASHYFPSTWTFC